MRARVSGRFPYPSPSRPQVAEFGNVDFSQTSPLQVFDLAQVSALSSARQARALAFA
jgi:hypothetical protein